MPSLYGKRKKRPTTRLPDAPGLTTRSKAAGSGDKRKPTAAVASVMPAPRRTTEEVQTALKAANAKRARELSEQDNALTALAGVEDNMAIEDEVSRLA
jgi:hypothetical protein